MAEPNRCTECGADLSSSVSPEGYCTKCLLRLGLAREHEAEEQRRSEPAPEDSSTATEWSAPDPPAWVGHWRIVRKLGEGGMGEVYLAEQEEPIRRKVALKLIKVGMDTEQVVARFESERQALALMDHPNIARVFEGGATNEGRPFFVMEFVPGIPITEYCDEHRLTTRERLDLFIRVCEGVQHAHQKGIIHRDLKPSNVLVALQDDTPVPKIIDFGVARATEQRLTERTVFTQLGVLIGTPEYMSPEQAEMTALDIDTRTDVYSLGVLLYELLVGALPFDPEQARRLAFDEICRRIREEEPSKPSTRVGTLGDASAESARRRNTSPSSLVRELRGDLDWITMKALEKDRTRRYGSPVELAADVVRYLQHEPVLAGPPSAAYRTRKFVRRHRIGVAFATVLVAVLIGFAATMAIQAARIARERTAAERVSEFLVDLFEVSDPSEARGSTITAREVLDRGVEKIERELADQPGIRGRLLQTMGRVYRNLGLHESAGDLLEKAVENRRRTLGDDHPTTLQAMQDLAWLSVKRGDYENAEKWYRRTLEGRRRVLGENHEDTLATITGLGNLYRILGRNEEAEPLLTAAYQGQRRLLGAEHSATAGAMTNLAMLIGGLGRFEEARQLLAEALEITIETRGEDHPDALAIRGNLASMCQRLGRYREAESLYAQVLEADRDVLGPEHPDTLLAAMRLANLYRMLGRGEEALPLFLEVLEAQRRVLDPSDRDLGLTMVNLAVLYTAQGRLEEAEPLLVESLRLFRENMGAESLETLVTMRCLGDVYARQRRFDEAEALLLEALRAHERLLGEEHPETLATLQAVGSLYSRQERYEEAEAAYTRALEGRRRVLGDEHRHTRTSAAALEAVIAKRDGASPE